MGSERRELGRGVREEGVRAWGHGWGDELGRGAREGGAGAWG